MPDFTKFQINTIAVIWTVVGILVFPLLLKIKAPYGKHISSKFGAMMPNRLGWVIMEIPSLIIIVYFFIQTPNLSRFLQFVFLLWIFHYFHRSLIFPFMTRTKNKKIPIVIVLMGFLFNIINAGLNGYWMSHFFDGQEITPFLTFRFGFGIFLFIIGMYINIRSDYKLINLRSKPTNGYKIPRGWMFEYISCPNYFGEIIQWLGFAIIALNLPAFSFLIWTMANLIPRALANHNWYKQHFADYPQNRKALFPGIL